MLNIGNVCTMDMGSYYLDPEYQQCYQLTDKSNVYSFRFMLIQLISSMLAIDRKHVQKINSANDAYSNHAISELVVNVLMFQSNLKLGRGLL